MPPPASRISRRTQSSVCSVASRTSRVVVRDLPQPDAKSREQRVVVEHLLEVRHQPLGVDAVAVQSATDLVVDAAALHGVRTSSPPSRARATRRCARHGAAGSRAPCSAETSARRQSRRDACRIARARARNARSSVRLSTRVQRSMDWLARAQVFGQRTSGLLDASRACRATRSTPRGARAGTTGAPVDPPAGSRCRRGTEPRRASGRPSWASRRARSAPARPACGWRRDRAAPRDRP